MKPHYKIIAWIIGCVVGTGLFVFLGYTVWYYKGSGVEQHGLALQEKPGFRAVHWHANLRIVVCGKERVVPANRGTPLLHTHRERNRIHIEGLIAGPQDVTLEKFMQAVGVPFGADYVWDVRNGNPCPDGQPGTWQMMILNDARSEVTTDYAINDSDTIELRFK